jgi:hypothetical protein
MQMHQDHAPQAPSRRPQDDAARRSWLVGVTRTWSRVLTREQVAMEQQPDSAAWEDTEIDVRRLVL